MTLDPDGDPNDVPMNPMVNALVAALNLVRHIRMKSTDSRGQRATKQSFYGLLVLTSAAAIAIVVQEIGGEGS